jgi:hypothetical protein
VGCFIVVTLFFANKNPLPKLTGVLEHCRAGENNYCFFIFRGVSFYHIPKEMKDVNVCSFFPRSNFSKLYKRIQEYF